MASLKVNGDINNNRVQLNTTVDKDILDEFKRSCKQIGIPMNVLLEAFMQQFSAGEFYLKLGKTKRDTDIELKE